MFIRDRQGEEKETTVPGSLSVKKRSAAVQNETTSRNAEKAAAIYAGIYTLGYITYKYIRNVAQFIRMDSDTTIGLGLIGQNRMEERSTGHVYRQGIFIASLHPSQTFRQNRNIFFVPFSFFFYSISRRFHWDTSDIKSYNGPSDVDPGFVEIVDISRIKECDRNRRSPASSKMEGVGNKLTDCVKREGITLCLGVRRSTTIMRPRFQLTFGSGGTLPQKPMATVSLSIQGERTSVMKYNKYKEREEKKKRRKEERHTCTHDVRVGWQGAVDGWMETNVTSSYSMLLLILIFHPLQFMQQPAFFLCIGPSSTTTVNSLSV